jgi:hypothetical protein
MLQDSACPAIWRELLVSEYWILVAGLSSLDTGPEAHFTGSGLTTLTCIRLWEMLTETLAFPPVPMPGVATCPAFWRELPSIDGDFFVPLFCSSV